MLTKFAADRAWLPLLRVCLKMLAAQTDKILFEPRREDWHDTPLHQISKLSNVPPRFIFEGLMSFVQRPNPWKENYFELRILKSFTGHGKKTENLLFQGTDGEGGAQQELSTGAGGKMMKIVPMARMLPMTYVLWSWLFTCWPLDNLPCEEHVVFSWPLACSSHNKSMIIPNALTPFSTCSYKEPWLTMGDIHARPNLKKYCTLRIIPIRTCFEFYLVGHLSEVRFRTGLS